MASFQNIWLLILQIFIIDELKADKEISIGFIIDPAQSNIPKEIATTLKEIEFKNNYEIKTNYISIDSTNNNESLIRVCEIISNPIHSLIIDLSYYSWSDDLQYICELKVPYIRIDITIMQYLRALEDYLIARKANDACFIFDSVYQLEDAIYYMVTKNVQIRLGLLNGMEKYFINKLKNMRPSPSYYGIFASTKNMNKIMKKVLNSKLLKNPDKWHLVFLDNNFGEFQTEIYNDKITKFSISYDDVMCHVSKSTKCYNLYRNSSIQHSAMKEILLQTIGQLKTFKTNSCDEHLQNASNCVIDLSPLFINNKNFIVEADVVSYYLNLTITNLSSNLLASWDSHKGIMKFSPTITPARRYFRIGTTEAKPWSYYKRDQVTGKLILNNDGNPIWEGYCIDLIEKLSEKLKFDFEIISPKYGTFGEKRSDDSWDGLVGDLVYGYTDMVVAALKMTSEREEVIDFIAPYFEQTGISIGIVIRKPVRQTSLFKFMTVLRTEVWLSIVAALVATAVMIWFLDKYSPYSGANNKSNYTYPCREFTLKESFWFALTSFTPQGGGEAPKAISGRVLVASYWLFVVLMLATFTANLAAFLTVERMQTPVQSLEQLARQSRINYTVVMNSDTHEYFINMKNAEDTLYTMWKELTLNATADQRKYRIWDYPIKEQYGHILLAINSSNPVKNAAEGFRKVNEHENADYAFIHDSAEIKYEITKNCNLTQVGEIFAEQPYAIAVQQGSHIQDELSYAILELQKDRYFEKLNAKFWNNSATRKCSASEENEGITLESLGGVFIATLFGLALAMITLVVEVFYYRNKAKKIQKITDVKSIIPKTGNYLSKEINISPPPSFDKAILQSRNISKNITLGSDTFKPARQRKPEIFMSISSKNSTNNKDAPPYYE